MKNTLSARHLQKHVSHTNIIDAGVHSHLRPLCPPIKNEEKKEEKKNKKKNTFRGGVRSHLHLHFPGNHMRSENMTSLSVKTQESETRHEFL